MGLELHNPSEPGTIPLDDLADDGSIAVVTEFDGHPVPPERFVQRKNLGLIRLGRPSDYDHRIFFSRKHDAMFYRCRLLDLGELLKIT